MRYTFSSYLTESTACSCYKDHRLKLYKGRVAICYKKKKRT